MVGANSEAAELLGYEQAEDLIDQPVAALTPGADAAGELVSEPGSSDPLRVTFRRRDGSSFRADIHQEQIRHKGQVATLIALRDATALAKTKMALRGSQEHLQALMGSAIDAIVTADSSGRICDWNPGGEHIFGYTRSEVVGQSMNVLFPERCEERFRESLERVGTTGKAQILGQSLKMYGRHKDGGSFPIELSLSRWNTDGEPYYTAIIRDITDRRTAQQELRGLNERLRSLAVRQQETREEERKRIARELHDVLGQALTTLRMDTTWITKNLKETTPDLEERLAEMNEQVDETIDALRHIITDLRPGILDDLGLVAALKWQSNEFEDRTGIACRFKSTWDGRRLASSASTAVFRIYQEILTNVMRHADASRVASTLEEDNNELVLRVRDNGRGIDEDEISTKDSLGILGMKERIAPWGGEVTFCGVPGEGTTVIVTLPLDQV